MRKRIGRMVAVAVTGAALTVGVGAPAQAAPPVKKTAWVTCWYRGYQAWADPGCGVVWT